MSKTAKRLSPAAIRSKNGAAKAGHPGSNEKNQKPRAPGPPAALRQAVAIASAVTEGKVLGLGATGLVRAMLASGQLIEARCPAHLDAAWLQEACARAPVDAVLVLAQPSGRHVVWGLFPGAVHADVRADVVIRGRQVKVDADSLQLSSRDARLDLDADGNVALKGRDVTSHARRVNRIKGGSIRLN